jgi:RecA-family ATPase
MSELIRYGKDTLTLKKKGINGLVPIKPGMKAAITGWPDATNWDADKISELTFKYKGYGIGLVSGAGVCALDIDVLDEAAATLVRQIVEKNCGVSPFVRIGQQPKIAIFYRGPDIPYIKHPFGLPIEVFGGMATKKASGQIILHGIHAKTGNEYIWEEKTFMDIESVDEIPLLDRNDLYTTLGLISDHPDLQHLKQHSTMSGNVKIGIDGIDTSTARSVWENSDQNPLALAEWMSIAEEGTRHATMLAAMNFLHSNEFSEAHFGKHIASLTEKQMASREFIIDEVYKSFRMSKPESSARDEFIRAQQWVNDNVEAPAIKQRKAIIEEFGPADIEDLEPMKTGINDEIGLFGCREDADNYGHGPEALVDGLMYKDVSLLAGPGGSHKTTVAIHEAICGTLGKPIWGRPCRAPYKTLFVSHEDEQTTIFGKIARIMKHDGYSEAEQDEVWRRVGVLYVGKRKFKLCRIVDDVVENNATTMAEMVSLIREHNFERVIFDPAISFGIGETRVNDAEQGLVMAARYLRSEGCMIEYIAHTGKRMPGKGLQTNTAFAPDQLSRMDRDWCGWCTALMAQWQRRSKSGEKLTGQTLTEEQSGIVIHIGKNTRGRDRESIYILRDNWRFEVIDQSQIEMALANLEEDKKSRAAEKRMSKELEEMQGMYDLISKLKDEDPEKSMSVNRLRGVPDDDRTDILKGAGYARLKRIWEALTGYGYISCKMNDKGNHTSVELIKRPSKENTSEIVPEDEF